MLGIFQLFILIALYSLSYAYKRLVRNGVSKKARWAFFIKHSIYVLVIIIVQMFQMIHNYFRIYWNDYTIIKLKKNDVNNAHDNNNNKLENIEGLSSVAMFFTGAILSFIRILDPYYRFVI